MKHLLDINALHLFLALLSLPHFKAVLVGHGVSPCGKLESCVSSGRAWTGKFRLIFPLDVLSNPFPAFIVSSLF